MFECPSFQPWLLNNQFYPINETETAPLKETQINKTAEYSFTRIIITYGFCCCRTVVIDNRQ